MPGEQLWKKTQQRAKCKDNANAYYEAENVQFRVTARHGRAVPCVEKLDERKQE